MAMRRRRVPGPAQSVGAPLLREPRVGAFGPQTGGLAQRLPWRTQKKQQPGSGPGMTLPGLGPKPAMTPQHPIAIGAGVGQPAPTPQRPPAYGAAGPRTATPPATFTPTGKPWGQAAQQQQQPGRGPQWGKPKGAPVTQATQGMRGPQQVNPILVQPQSPSDINAAYHAKMDERMALINQKIAAYKAAHPGATDYDATFGPGGIMNDPQVVGLQQEADALLGQFFQAQYGAAQGQGVAPGSPAAKLLGHPYAPTGPVGDPRVPGQAPASQTAQPPAPVPQTPSPPGVGQYPISQGNPLPPGTQYPGKPMTQPFPQGIGQQMGQQMAPQGFGPAPTGGPQYMKGPGGPPSKAGGAIGQYQGGKKTGGKGGQGQQQGGKNPPIPPVTYAPPPPQSGAAPGDYFPIDPLYEAQRRAADDALSAELASIGIARDQIPAVRDLLLARMATDQGETNRQINNVMNDRGIWDSGITTANIARSDLQYDRARQDQAFQFQQVLNELLGRESEATLGYDQNLMEAMLALAGRQEETYMPLDVGLNEAPAPKPKSAKNKPKPKGKSGKRRKK